MPRFSFWKYHKNQRNVSKNIDLSVFSRPLGHKLGNLELRQENVTQEKVGWVNFLLKPSFPSRRMAQISCSTGMWTHQSQIKQLFRSFIVGLCVAQMFGWTCCSVSNTCVFIFKIAWLESGVGTLSVWWWAVKASLQTSKALWIFQVLDQMAHRNHNVAGYYCVIVLLNHMMYSLSKNTSLIVLPHKNAIISS